MFHNVILNISKSRIFPSESFRDPIKEGGGKRKEAKILDEPHFESQRILQTLFDYRMRVSKNLEE